MKRFAVVLLLAGLSQSSPSSSAAPRPDTPQVIPTSPQIPSPYADNGSPGADAPRLSLATRIKNSLGLTTSDAAPATLPLPTGYAQASVGGCAAPGCGAPGCGSAQKRSFAEHFKAWLCFYPSPGPKLPLLNPHPYVGPITGIYSCSPSCGAGCCPADGCASGSCAGNAPGRNGPLGRMGPLLPQGCKSGCVPPANDAIPGYRFADPSAPAVSPPMMPPPTQASYTTYKPITKP
jgi:hypothetical protein